MRLIQKSGARVRPGSGCKKKTKARFTGGLSAARDTSGDGHPQPQISAGTCAGRRETHSPDRDDDTTFGFLDSRFDELRALRMGTSPEDRPRYTPATSFETVGFPGGLTPDMSAAA